MATVEKIGVKIKGLNELQAQLKKSPIIAGKHLSIAIRTSSLILLRHLKIGGIVPVATIASAGYKGGLLKRSIRTSYQGHLKASIATHTNYAIYVHEGTKYMKSRPFFEIAIKDKLRFIQKEFDLAGSRIVKELAR